MMGMFDSFYFKKGVLPDNKVSEDHEFQTKSLDCSLDKYFVDEDGFVKKYEFFEEGSRKPKPEEKPVNEAAYVYSYEFPEDDEGNSLPTKYQEYKIVIANSKLVFVEKIREEGYEEANEESL